jgi:hypothetical protein
MYGKMHLLPCFNFSLNCEQFELGFNEDSDFNITQFHRKSVGKTEVGNALSVM